MQICAKIGAIGAIAQKKYLRKFDACVDACVKFTHKLCKIPVSVCAHTPIVRNLCAYANCAQFVRIRQFCAFVRIRQFCALFVYKGQIFPEGTLSGDGRVGKAAAKEAKGPGFESGQGIIFFVCFFLARTPIFLQFFFCVNSTHASTQKTKLRKICKPYNARKFDAQSAHVARLRRYCANHKVAQFRRKIGAIRRLGN